MPPFRSLTHHRFFRPGTAALAAAMLLHVESGAAQSVPTQGIRYSAVSLLTSGNGPRCSSFANVTAEADWKGLSATVLSAPVASDTRYGTSAPIIALGARSPVGHRWQIETSASIGHAESDCAAFSAWSRAFGQLSRTIGRGGIGISYGYGNLSSLDPSQDRHGLGVAIWQKVRRMNITLDVRTHDRIITTTSRETIGTPQQRHGTPEFPGDTGITVWDTVYKDVSTATAIRSFDLRSRLQLRLGRVAFDLTGSSTIGHRPDGRETRNGTGNGIDTLASVGRNALPGMLRMQFWSSIKARIPVASWLEVAPGIAVLPAQPSLTAPMRGVFSLGINVMPGGRAASARGNTDAADMQFETVRDDSVSVRLRFRVNRASAVQVSSELTQWTPVAMTRVGKGWWEATVQAPPGTYRMNVSIDGASWQPPPGVPAVRDEFGGQVGLVTVR